MSVNQAIHKPCKLNTANAHRAEIRASSTSNVFSKSVNFTQHSFSDQLLKQVFIESVPKSFCDDGVQNLSEK